MSASALSLSRPAQASLTLPPDRSAAQRRPWSRGSSPCDCPPEPLVGYRINRQLSGWNSSSTDDSRLRGALPKTDSCTAAITRPLLMSRSAARSRLVIVDTLSSDGPLQIFAHELDMMSQHVQHACICGRDPEIVCLLL